MSRSYYLIDFENVKSDGVSGISNLTAEDEVFLFYTKNADKININLLEILRGLEAEFHAVSVSGGKQALDNQLDSYLGYLIGIHGNSAEYNIISRDKGFHVMQDFWKDYTINLRESIGADAAATPPEKPDSEKKNRSPKQKHSTAKARGETADKAKAEKSTDKTLVNTEVQKVLSKSGLEADIINSVASITANNLLSKNGKQLVYREIIKKYGQKQGLEIYNLVKPTIHGLLR